MKRHAMVVSNAALVTAIAAHAVQPDFLVYSEDFNAPLNVKQILAAKRFWQAMRRLTDGNLIFKKPQVVVFVGAP